jgi:pyruvate dehydrogenase E2 component (dihydrolipoamide acetyltransferase)
VQGTGPNGRIVRADVEKAQTAPAPVAIAAPAPVAPAPKPAAPAPVITAPHTKIPHSTMRKVIARRLTESKQTVPHFYLTVNIELDALLKLRAELNAKSPKDGAGAFKLSVNDLIIKASAVALKRHPGVNASWTDEAIIQYDEVDVSVAVSIPDGLITPIVKGADRLGLAAISNSMKDLAARAKAGKLKPDEFQGGGFSISNLGMFGIAEFSAIVNPPQAAILAVGAGERRAVVKGDAIVAATVMSVTLSVDHRVIDGALGAQFLQTLKGLIEEPLSLLL